MRQMVVYMAPVPTDVTVLHAVLVPAECFALGVVPAKK